MNNGRWILYLPGLLRRCVSQTAGISVHIFVRTNRMPYSFALASFSLFPGSTVSLGAG